LLVSLVGVLFVLWLLVLVNSFHLPVYLDSLFTIGAGARLAEDGILSPTFMLYGLINPYILYLFLRADLGAWAPYLLRIVQFIVAISGYVVLSLVASSATHGSSRRLSNLSALVAIFGSAVILIESFELTPEIVTFSVFCAMIYLMLNYKPNKVYPVLTGLFIALLVGARPTGIVIAIPVFLNVTEHYAPNTYANKYWRWLLLAVASVAALLSAFPGIVSTYILSISVLVLLLPATLVMCVIDVKRGYADVWKGMLQIVVSFCVFLLLLFPGYIINYHELVRQIIQYHIELEVQNGTIQSMVQNILLILLNVTIAFAGPLAAIGFFTSVGVFMLRGNRGNMMMRTVMLFAIGVIPFVIIMARNDNLQTRYAIPLMPLVFAVSSLGIKYIVESKIKYLIIIPFLISSYQIYEVVHNKTDGGVLNAFYDLGESEEYSINVETIGPCDAHYYGGKSGTPYPLLPYTSGTLHDADAGSVIYEVSFNVPPPSHTLFRTYGCDYHARNYLIRGSRHPGWAGFVYLVGRPWVWRGWGIVYVTGPFRQEQE